MNNTAIKQMSIAPAYLIFSFIPNPFLYCNLFEYIRKNIHIILFYLQKQLSSIRPAQAVDFWLKWFFLLLFLVFYPEFIYYEVRLFLRKRNLP
jgi:hypothetical protein